MDVRDVIKEIVHLQNKKTDLEFQIKEKRKIVQDFLDKKQKDEISFVSCKEYEAIAKEFSVKQIETIKNIDYNIDALESTLDRALFKEVVIKQYYIKPEHFQDVQKVFKQALGENALLTFTRCFSSIKAVDKQKLQVAFSQGRINPQKFKNCYTATISKSLRFNCKTIKKEVL